MGLGLSLAVGSDATAPLSNAAKLGLWRCSASTPRMWTDNGGIYRRSVSDFVFKTVPNAQQSRARHGATLKTTTDHGLWYANAMTVGTLGADTPFQEKVHCNPRRAWVVSLHEAGKLTSRA